MLVQSVGRTTENLAQEKSPLRPSSSSRSSIRRGSSGAPPPSVTGAIETITSSSSPASANWPARSPPPTIQMFRPPAARDHLLVHRCDVGARELDAASGTTGSCRCVKTQHGMSYGHLHSAGSLPANSWSRIHS